MKAIKCEMCGSNDVVKQDSLYVCQNCGTKYSVEEARKLMIEGTVDVKGTVKVDTSDELEKLYYAARNAIETENWEAGKKYYEMILEKDPNSWEANFYSVFCKGMSCVKKNRYELVQEVRNLKNSLDFLFALVKDNVPEGDGLKRTNSEIHSRCRSIAEKAGRFDRSSGALLMFSLGDTIESKLGSMSMDFALMSWKSGIKIGNKPLFSRGVKLQREERKRLRSYSKKIKRYDKSFSLLRSRVGCYVATAVYGSYNCPEVWTLRRFRDNTLDATWYGRAFIKTYYAISPTLVKWFGDTEWFKKMWRKPLDRMVDSLQKKGVESTPYQDKY